MMTTPDEVILHYLNARHAGTCVTCGKRFKRGERIAWYPQTGSKKHRACAVAGERRDDGSKQSRMGGAEQGGDARCGRMSAMRATTHHRVPCVDQHICQTSGSVRTRASEL